MNCSNSQKDGSGPDPFLCYKEEGEGGFMRAKPGAHAQGLGGGGFYPFQLSQQHECSQSSQKTIMSLTEFPSDKAGPDSHLLVIHRLFVLLCFAQTEEEESQE